MKVQKGASTVRTALEEMQRPETTERQRWFLLAFVLQKLCDAHFLFMSTDQDYWPKQPAPPKPPKPPKDRWHDAWWWPWNR